MMIRIYLCLEKKNCVYFELDQRKNRGKKREILKVW